MFTRGRLLAGLVPLWLAAPPNPIPPTRVAVLSISLNDLSNQPASPELPARMRRLWDQIAPRLRIDCRALVYGTPALVAPQRGWVLAVALGTEYGLRLDPSSFSLARAAGAEVVHYYRTAQITLDLAARFGPGWVFGTFDRREPEWCAAALEFAEPAA